MIRTSLACCCMVNIVSPCSASNNLNHRTTQAAMPSRTNPDPDLVFRSLLNLSDLGEHRRNAIETMRLVGPGDASDATTPIYTDGDSGQSITYAEYRMKIALLANVLSSPILGLERGACIALHLPNCLEMPVAFHATLLACRVAALVSPSLTKDEVAYQLDKCGAKLVMADPSMWDITWPAVMASKARPRIILARAAEEEKGERAPAGIMTLIELLEHARRLPAFVYSAMTPKESMHTPAIIPFSSGTSGPPKAVVLSHSNQSTSTLQIASTMRAALARRPGQLKPTTIVSFIPLCHVFGVNYMLSMAVHLVSLTLPSFALACLVIANPDPLSTAVFRHLAEKVRPNAIPLPHLPPQASHPLPRPPRRHSSDLDAGIRNRTIRSVECRVHLLRRGPNETRDRGRAHRSVPGKGVSETGVRDV